MTRDQDERTPGTPAAADPAAGAGRGGAARRGFGPGEYEGPVSGYEEEATGEAGPTPPEPVPAPAGGEAPAGRDEGSAQDAAEVVEHDIEELRERAGKADEYLDLARRTQADFDNFRKRTARDAAVAEGRGVIRLARELLPALDNLEHALAAVEAGGAGHDVAEGFRLVHEELMAALGRSGIEVYAPLGEPFDPARDEAMAQRPQDGAEPGTVIEVYQRGYRLGDAVLRPARVVVAG